MHSLECLQIEVASILHGTTCDLQMVPCQIIKSSNKLYLAYFCYITSILYKYLTYYRMYFVQDLHAYIDYMESIGLRFDS